MNENLPEPKLPSWCKVGQWVTENSPEYSIGYIDRILSNTRVHVVWKRCYGADDDSICASIYTFKPLCFRPYKFYEAKRLLGKVLERDFDDEDPTPMNTPTRRAELITSVEDQEPLLINNMPQDYIAHYGATISGMPFGTPEIDEEALKRR